MHVSSTRARRCAALLLSWARRARRHVAGSRLAGLTARHARAQEGRLWLRPCFHISGARIRYVLGVRQLASHVAFARGPSGCGARGILKDRSPGIIRAHGGRHSEVILIMLVHLAFCTSAGAWCLTHQRVPRGMLTQCRM